MPVLDHFGTKQGTIWGNCALSNNFYFIDVNKRYLFGPDSYKLKLVADKFIYLMECLNKVYKFFCCITDPVFPRPYTFSFGSPGDQVENIRQFQSNFVRTSKYRWYDFLPKSLILQFYRLANIYFLIIGILQTIPSISPLGPLTAWGPLIVVLGISMIRQGYEDYQRYKSDKQLNLQLTTQVFRDGRFANVVWSEVIIGDIVRVQSQQLFPVDLILLASAIEGGTAFIETASLDGQKNLKPRNAFPATQRYASEEQLLKLRGRWDGIVPDKQLHKFSSNLTLSGGQTVNFQKDKQLLYRGARLKNTKWVYGLCIYTGRNTKIMMNSDSSSQKMSQIQLKVNYVLGIILLIQILLCLVVAVLDGFFVSNNRDSHTYIAFGSYSTGLDAFLIWCSYFVLINTMIPISLVVSIEIVKMSQSYFIDKDKLMYSDFRKKYASVKSASLNEELGQIEYIFTDKTGTLTMNLMEFKIAVIGRKMYGDLGLVVKDANRPPQEEKGFHDAELTSLINKGANSTPVNDISVKDREGRQTLNFANSKELAEEFLTLLAVTHQVVAQTDKKGNKFYQGPSPDEITLVDAAKAMGFEFNKSTQSTTQISVRGEARKYELLEVFPFNSDRKRMSVVIRDTKGLIKLYIKGADSIIKARLSPHQKLNLDSQLGTFSRIGLRTLLVGMRLVSNEQYKEFKRNMQAIPLGPEKQQKLNDLISQFQGGIHLLGATAVLDRLQEEVPETIRDLIRAKIKIWMLTGDKMQTAQNIAKSCNLIQQGFQILRYESKNRENILMELKALSARAEQLSLEGKAKGFLIEGEDLTPIIGNEQNEKELANLAKYCDAVVCCRLLPIQKAEVVRIVRTRLNKITLSIGDGANDVPMIKTAHIGVGLFGEEGMGAVQASDYALPQFRMLWRLLLVHGRWNYIRIAEMVLYFFYKNMLFTIPQFIFAFYCGFSAQTIFDDIYISLYNLFFTAFPLVVRAIFEQDVYFIRPAAKTPPKQEATMTNIVKPHVLETKQNRYIPKQYEMNKYLYRLFPKIYFIGQQNCIFNFNNFFLWIIEGIVQAIVISLFSIYIFSAQSLNSSGYSNDMWLTSLTIFTTVVCVVTMKLATHTKFWSTLLFFSIIFLSLGLYVAYMWISNWYVSPYVTNTISMFFTTGQTYFVVIFCCCLVLLVDGVVVSVDFNRGGYASRMRMLIVDQQQVNRKNYQQLSIRQSDLITHNANQQI